MICLDIFPTASCVSGMCYADVCLLGAPLRQRISRWFMNRLLSTATSGLRCLGLESACTMLLFLFLDLQARLVNQMLEKSKAEEVLASELFWKSLARSKGWVLDKGAQGKRWVVNGISRGGKSVRIAASRVGSHGSRVGLPRKSFCRTKDIRGKSLQSIFIVWVVGKVTSGRYQGESIYVTLRIERQESAKGDTQAVNPSGNKKKWLRKGEKVCWNERNSSPLAVMGLRLVQVSLDIRGPGWGWSSGTGTQLRRKEFPVWRKLHLNWWDSSEIGARGRVERDHMDTWVGSREEKRPKGPRKERMIKMRCRKKSQSIPTL